MNKVILIGNLTREPELTETSNGISVCRFSMAVERDFADNQGNRQTDFFNIVAWRGLAETCAKYLGKGKKVCVVGTLQNRKYEDSEGAIKYVTEIVANEVEFLSPKEKESAGTEERPKLTPIDDNQLPF